MTSEGSSGSSGHRQRSSSRNGDGGSNASGDLVSSGALLQQHLQHKLDISLGGNRTAGRSENEGDVGDGQRKGSKDHNRHVGEADHFPPVNQLNPGGQHSGTVIQGEAKKLDRASLIAMGAAALSR